MSPYDNKVFFYTQRFKAMSHVEPSCLELNPEDKKILAEIDKMKEAEEAMAARIDPLLERAARPPRACSMDS